MSNSRNSRNRRIVRRALARRQGKNYINPTSSGRKKSLGSTKGYGTQSSRSYIHDFTIRQPNKSRNESDFNIPTKKDIPSKMILHPESYDKMKREYGVISRSGTFENIGTVKSQTRDGSWGQEGGE